MLFSITINTVTPRIPLENKIALHAQSALKANSPLIHQKHRMLMGFASAMQTDQKNLTVKIFIYKLDNHRKKGRKYNSHKNRIRLVNRQSNREVLARNLGKYRKKGSTFHICVQTYYLRSCLSTSQANLAKTKEKPQTFLSNHKRQHKFCNTLKIQHSVVQHHSNVEVKEIGMLLCVLIISESEYVCFIGPILIVINMKTDNWLLTLY